VALDASYRWYSSFFARQILAEDLPLFTTNPDDFAGLGDLLTIVPVTARRCPTSGETATAPGSMRETGSAGL
jgi:hypothetical protein